MPPAATKSEKKIFSSKFKVKIIYVGVIWKGIISWVCMPSIEYLSTTVKKL